jgi:hypothetical protein
VSGAKTGGARITIFIKLPGLHDPSGSLLSKRISLVDGRVVSDGSPCRMALGDAEVVHVPTASDLANAIAAMGSNNALALGCIKDHEKARIVTAGVLAGLTKHKMPDGQPIIARSREYIDYEPGPAWALLDSDTKGMPAPVSDAVAAMGGIWNALTAVAPGLLRAARVSRGSTSAGLYREDTGEQFAGSGGAHNYVLVKDAADIARLLHDLHDRCWLHGLGWHITGDSGQLLERSLVDRMVGYGEHLCFEGAPVIAPPLAQDPAQRVPKAFEGEAIDTGLIVPRLTEYERHRVEEIKTASAEALDKTAAEIRARHDAVLAEKISTKTGMPLVSALRLVKARHRGVLLPHLELDFDHLDMATVADVLAEPDRYIGETLADPLEGAVYGRCKAKIMQASDGTLFIHSFAHGRGLYRLRYDAQSAKAAVAKAPADGIVDYAMAIFAASEMEADEVADFAAVVAKIADVGVAAVKARITKERREREQAERKAAIERGADGRIVRPRPEPDGELTPVVTFLDQLFAADPSEEPPMRDASGNLVEVRVREPWALHLLTSDGANNDADDDVEIMKPPAEPALVRLTPVGVQMMTEKYVCWVVTKKYTSYFGTLSRPYIDALMQFSPSAIPVVRAINTSPLITMSGRIIDGVGFDRDTGLFHRIDPLLAACLPTEIATEQAVRDAVLFLFDEWLVDVALDRVGKSIAIMFAMTLIERALLPERPAFFVTAGQRGGGKTTLVNMITLAALGRRAAASSWSDNAEERKKSLFSHLRQGVACVFWDNIARGSAISCPHIEAALTAAEITDRVLGISRVETVPSTTVHGFTGNSITPRGDMASRSLMLALNVDRPDPENRFFVHADPLAWTQVNRSKIVRALYTLLVAGALNRPKRQVAKTRFKTWWSLVGWPMEYAADLIGTVVDCTELMRAGEVGDEEATAASAALSILHEIFGARLFTAREVVKAMTIEPKIGGWSAPTSDDEDKQAQAEAISGALGELVGKRLDRPTAFSIGKLFQKTLVGRPAWIDDGQDVATLRRSAGHNENTYFIEVRGYPAGAAAGKVGKVGNVGNVSALAPSDSNRLSQRADRDEPSWKGRI